MPIQLSARQQALFDYLNRTVTAEGRVPSLRQAAADLGISHAAVAQGLKVLEEKGCVKREGRYSRTVFLLNEARQAAAVHRWREIPVVGRVTAGLPMYAQQEWDGTLILDAALYKEEQHLFALRVQGDSMREAAILDGDLAICTPRQYARNGEIIVALVHHEEATVKRFFLHKDRIELRPANPAFQPTFYGFDEVLVQGKVVGVHRGPEGIK